MKRAAYLLLGALLGLVIGSLLAWAFNRWYAGRFINSDDDANLLVSLLLFGF